MDMRTLFQRSAQFHGDASAVIDSSGCYTFAECWTRGVQLANLLLQRGARPGDRVASLEGNSIRATDIWIACAVGNFVRVPLYSRDSRRSQAVMIDNVAARVLVIDQEDDELIAATQEGELRKPDIIVVRGGDYPALLAESSARVPDIAIDESDICLIRHTSGTTGKPKGVPNTHRQWLALSRDCVSFIPPAQPGDTFVHIAPSTHASGYFAPMMWAAGACQVMVPSAKPDVVIDWLIKHHARYTFMPPPLLNMIVRQAEESRVRVTGLKALLIGSAPISAELVRRAAAVFGSECLHQIYGVSEAVTPVAMGPAEWFADLPGSIPLHSIGRPLPCADVEVRDEENRPLPIGTEGELAIRCDSQMTGYFGDTDEVRAQTAERIVDGWIRTGDMARIDRNGYVYLLDRKSDLIISGGFNIYPAELERVIAEHPDVIEVTVFGIAHEKWGETPWAVCYVTDSATVVESDIVDLVRDQLGSMKKPTRVHFVREPLPRNPVGKIQRRAVRDTLITAAD